MDLLITDPPYNVAYVGKTKNVLTIVNDNQDRADFINFLTDAFANAGSVMRNGAAYYVWHPALGCVDFALALEKTGLKPRQQIVWVKNALVLGRRDYHWKHEPCFYGWKDGAAHLWTNDKKQTTVLNFERPQRNKEHPTMKPVKMFDYQIKNNTNAGDAVLDLFGGSGTTMIACEQNGRSAYLMEIDPKYCDVIIDRWEKLTGEKAERIS